MPERPDDLDDEDADAVAKPRKQANWGIDLPELNWIVCAVELAKVAYGKMTPAARQKLVALFQGEDGGLEQRIIQIIREDAETNPALQADAEIMQELQPPSDDIY